MIAELSWLLEKLLHSFANPLFRLFAGHADFSFSSRAPPSVLPWWSSRRRVKQALSLVKWNHGTILI